jgi:hypothetical protein
MRIIGDCESSGLHHDITQADGQGAGSTKCVTGSATTNYQIVTLGPLLLIAAYIGKIRKVALLNLYEATSRISKGLEAVIAARLSYIAEKHDLLPENHFGARPRRSAEQALNVMVERIYQAWRSRQILTLVSFDVKGAFNGVHASVLKQRLAERRVPQQAVK